MRKEIQLYNNNLEVMDKDICDLLANTIDRELAGENKIWCGHPVWFLDGNPIVGLVNYHGASLTSDKGRPLQTGYGRASVGAIKSRLSSRQKDGYRLMFWSGIHFEEEKLKKGSGKFKDASVFYTSTNLINQAELKRWLQKSLIIQWDYKNIVKRKGQLLKLK